MLNMFLRWMSVFFMGLALYLEYTGAPVDKINNAMLWAVMNGVMALQE